ncbi:hypothetical protein [Plantactinospora endophytica]|uniref:Uncharacterized protein n=1 Tax=Plantactinospora endophytica TaxID=673535 RepID=A0ABQ4E8R7_9ACTN|nr:hypothetical protein [Plantactinospora endophytica]GIG90677.1 hypothetical protein Pen02_56130 [Plantactinospora endophytica]
MTTNGSHGGFAGDPHAALTVVGSASCCGNPARATNIRLPDPTERAGGTCCGAPAAEADSATTSPRPEAGADAAATSSGCCG